MRWTKVDQRWLREAKAYFTNKEAVATRETGFFNGGQKLYFWSIVFSAAIFFITGLSLWFDHVVHGWLVAVSYVLHDVAAVIMLLGFVAHIYETTAAQPGTFPAMLNGTVTEKGPGHITRDGTQKSLVVIPAKLWSVRARSRPKRKR